MAPGFELTPPFDTAGVHELALNSAGYEWTKVKTLSYNEVHENLHQLGKVGYLIIKGYLTLNRENKKGRPAFPGRNKIVHLGVQVQGPEDKRAVLRRQFTVVKDGLYDIEANTKGGCTFVEGHVCLSPAFAIELLQDGHIHWRDEDGRKVRQATMLRLLQDTTIESDKVRVPGKKGMKMRFTVTVPKADTDRDARQLQQWFEDEWRDYESKRGDTKKVDTKTLYRTPAKDEDIVEPTTAKKDKKSESKGKGSSSDKTGSVSRQKE